MKQRSFFPLLVLLATLLAGIACNDSRPRPKQVQSFGQRQLDQLLADRPEMRGAIPAAHPVVSWVTAAFDGSTLGHRVYWNASPPQSGRPAEHAPPYAGYPAHISISGESDETPLDKWASLVYEFHNLENSLQFEEVQTRAIRGKIDADEFASECVRLEFEALERTRDYFFTTPLTTQSNSRDHFYNWVTNDLGTFEEYEAAFQVPWTNYSNSNFEYFRDYYETELVPYAAALAR